MKPKSALVCLSLLVAPVAIGCADTSEDESEDSALALARANSETTFDREMDELEQRYARAQAEGEPSDPSAVGAQGFGMTFTRGKLCSYLGPLRNYEHAYFYFGGFVGADFVVGAQVGMDFVFDLWNRQAGVFTWKNATANVGTAGSVSAGGYMGYGFGNKANVIDAWAGRFDSASVSIDIPGTKLGVEGSGFRAPDNSIIGASVAITAGLAASWPLPATGSVETGFWVPFDGGTRAVSAWSVGTSRSFKTASALSADPRVSHRSHPENHVYVQYAKSTDLALAIVENAPAGIGFLPAAQAVATGILRDSGHTISQLCPAH